MKIIHCAFLEGYTNKSSKMLSRMHLISPSSWSIKFKNVSCSPSRFPSKEATFYLKQYPSILIHCRGKATNGDQDSSLSKCRERENSQITLAKKVNKCYCYLIQPRCSEECLTTQRGSGDPFGLKNT
ncbi:hypothetical protein TNCV_3814211 [Trichonephila clavipes]|nr:hypothetical protein TNCV_3814211 [Trichonephila clavipes]